MALTKMNFYLGFLLAYGMIIISSMLFLVAQINNPLISYKTGNDDFVNNYVGYVRQSNVTVLSEQEVKELKEESLITEDNETGEYSVTDQLASINYYSGKVGKSVAYLRLIYNSPSFVVYTLGLPYEDVRHIINILGIVLFIAMIVLTVKAVRGS